MPSMPMRRTPLAGAVMVAVGALTSYVKVDERYYRPAEVELLIGDRLERAAVEHADPAERHLRNAHGVAEWKLFLNE